MCIAFICADSCRLCDFALHKNVLNMQEVVNANLLSCTMYVSNWYANDFRNGTTSTFYVYAYVMTLTLTLLNLCLRCGFFQPHTHTHTIAVLTMSTLQHLLFLYTQKMNDVIGIRQHNAPYQSQSFESTYLMFMCMHMCSFAISH